MQVSEAEKGELEEILQLQYLAYAREAELYDDFNIPPLRQTLKELVEESNLCRVLVAKLNDSIVGSVRAHMDGTVCKIGRLIVNPKFQRKGIGTTLMKEIELCFSDAEIYEIFTGNKSTANIRLYNRLGYYLAGESKLNDNVNLVYLQKQKNYSRPQL